MTASENPTAENYLLQACHPANLMEVRMDNLKNEQVNCIAAAVCGIIATVFGVFGAIQEGQGALWTIDYNFLILAYFCLGPVAIIWAASHWRKF